MNGQGRKKARRSYSPVVEALEALRLLSSDTGVLLPGLPAVHDLASQPLPTEPQPLSPDAWDTALGQTRLADLIGPVVPQTTPATDEAGLRQLEKYLSRTWFRAGIPEQQHADCTQAVYVTLLANLGRAQFDSLMEDVGQHGIREVLSRETPEGPDFFRAIDTVKKRAQRERTLHPLDEQANLLASRPGGVTADWRDALQEAIDLSLSPREAALIQATIRGETPLEIASQWGVAPKTVSNEKTRVIQKLRDFLSTELPD